MTAYLTVSAAITYATAMGLTRFLAKDAAAQAALLLMATLDIDAAGPYQGRRYDLTAAQEHEFPRVPYGEPVTGQWPVSGAVNEQVWDWDALTQTAVVPELVQIATLLQADALCDTAAQARLEAIRAGLKSQSLGDASETYLSPAELAAAGVGAGGQGLCPRAANIMGKYQLRTGRLL